MVASARIRISTIAVLGGGARLRRRLLARAPAPRRGRPRARRARAAPARPARRHAGAARRCSPPCGSAATLALARSSIADGACRARWRAGAAGRRRGRWPAVVLAAGSPLHALLFDAEEGRRPARRRCTSAATRCSRWPSALPIAARGGRVERAAHAGRGRAGAPRTARPRRCSRPAPAASPGTASPAAALVAGAFGLARRRRARRARGLTRRRRARPRRSSRDRLPLFINDGHVAMVDGTIVYMRGLRRAPAGRSHAEPDHRAAGLPARRPRARSPAASTRCRRRPRPRGGRAREAPGIDPSGIGLHFIRRRHWASFFPRRTIVAETGSTIRLRITNRLAEPHTFTIDGVVERDARAGGLADRDQDVDFPAPAAGTYVYQDTDRRARQPRARAARRARRGPRANPWTFDGARGRVRAPVAVDPPRRRSRVGPARAPGGDGSTRWPRRACRATSRSTTAAGSSRSAVSPDEAENHRTHEDTTPCAATAARSTCATSAIRRRAPAS